ncbi:MAG: TetR family transcriptional regulator [Phyllobacteriaceae bacterium]|nr:TetR family transcriptional regulator [Phyllobacteriaceae bacterium]MBA92829.1 TetR family transcriptional regulator [Phyllobacteriaceae bacterium]
MAKRAEKAQANRQAILDAAAVVVGRHGYGKASIARIAEEAGVAHGLIYLYFKNQQDLFDQLLPHVGEAMLRYIAQATLEAQTLADREREGLEANFAYLRQHPALHRILNEAAFFAPAAHQQYLRRMAGGYTRSLQRGWAAGEIDGYDESELEVLAYMIIGAREYLLERYAVSGSRIDELPAHVKTTYLRMVARSLGIDETRMLSGSVEARQAG